MVMVSEKACGVAFSRSSPRAGTANQSASVTKSFTSSRASRSKAKSRLPRSRATGMTLAFWSGGRSERRGDSPGGLVDEQEPVTNDAVLGYEGEASLPGGAHRASHRRTPKRRRASTA